MTSDLAATTAPMADILLFNKPFGSILFLGTSGSGKSTLIKKALLNYAKLYAESNRRDIYLLNVFSDEYQVLFANEQHQFTVHENATLKTTFKPYSILIVEDIISLTNKEHDLFRRIANFHVHHSNLLLFAVSHNCHRTGITSVLPHFNSIIFVAQLDNVIILKNTLIALGFDKSEVERLRSIFSNIAVDLHLEPLADRPYLAFNSFKRKLFYAANTDAALSGQWTPAPFEKTTSGAPMLHRKSSFADKLMQNFQLMIAGSERLNKQHATAIFNILMQGLDHITDIREYDLSMQLENKSGVKFRISIVDYICALLSAPQPTAVASVQMLPPGRQPEVIWPQIPSHLLSFHLYVIKKCIIPSIYITHPAFMHARSLPCPPAVTAVAEGII